VATKCTNCGAVLAKDGARFCNNCGMPVVSHSVHRESITASKDGTDSSPGNKPTAAPIASARGKSRPALREQIAQQPPARPVRLISPDKSPRSAAHGETFSVPAQEQKAEDLPTRPLDAPQQGEDQAGPPLAGEHAAEYTYQDEVALLDTVHLTTSAQWNSMVPSTPASPLRQQTSIGGVSSHRRQETAADLPASPFLPLKQRKHRIPLLVIVALLCLLVVGGLGTWIAVSQPFSVPVVTQPQQNFKESSLGLSLLYPSGWMTQIDHAKATVHFYDSSHTSEVIIIVKDAAAAGNVAQYLQQQATQLGMTGAKVGTPLSFAGATWPLVQGSVQRSGANYTASVLATIHDNHLFTFIQLAPQSIYADEEKLIFSAMRSSLQFM
jgi:predicted  nucleic acid-binding Zn-ribbon protein